MKRALRAATFALTLGVPTGEFLTRHAPCRRRIARASSPTRSRHGHDPPGVIGKM
jgi:hypothetical protein